MLIAFTLTSHAIAFSTSPHASTGPILTLSLSSLRLFPSLPHWLELGPPSRGGSRERAVATHSNSFSLLASHAWDSIDVREGPGRDQFHWVLARRNRNQLVRARKPTAVNGADLHRARGSGRSVNHYSLVFGKPIIIAAKVATYLDHFQ